jgi:hypothetical protein
MVCVDFFSLVSARIHAVLVHCACGAPVGNDKTGWRSRQRVQSVTTGFRWSAAVERAVFVVEGNVRLQKQEKDQHTSSHEDRTGMGCLVRSSYVARLRCAPLLSRSRLARGRKPQPGRMERYRRRGCNRWVTWKVGRTLDDLMSEDLVSFDRWPTARAESFRRTNIGRCHDCPHAYVRSSLLHRVACIDAPGGDRRVSSCRPSSFTFVGPPRLISPHITHQRRCRSA